jgi:hypothetical protein
MIDLTCGEILGGSVEYPWRQGEVVHFIGTEDSPTIGVRRVGSVIEISDSGDLVWARLSLEAATWLRDSLTAALAPPRLSVVHKQIDHNAAAISW